jgi:hypothetical protein
LLQALPFDPENFTFWSILFQAYVRKGEWALFEEIETELDYQETLNEYGG